MRNGGKLLGMGGLVRLLLALSLAAAAFAHRPVPLADAAAADLAAYVLPDGSAPSLCITQDGEHDKHHDRSGGCEFCRIATTILLHCLPDVFEGRGLRRVPALSSGKDILRLRSCQPR